MNQLVAINSFSEKFLWSITALHNEHILFFNHLIAWSYYEMFGQINFKGLQIISSLLVILTWILFQRMVNKKLSAIDHLKYFEVISGLLLISGTMLFFNMSNYESAFRATDQPQKLGVLIVAFLCFHTFLNGNLWTAMLLAISGLLFSANGIFITISIFFLCLIDPEKRTQKNILIWSASSFLVVMIYWSLTKDYPKNEVGYLDLRDISSWSGLVFHYFSSCGSLFHPISHGLAIATGIAINMMLAYKIFLSKDQNQKIFYLIMTFLILSFMSTSYGRAAEGYQQAFSSRYKLYSHIFFFTSILLALTSIKKYQLMATLAIFIAIVYVMPMLHNRSFPRIKERNEQLQYVFKHFTLNPDDTVQLNFTPNQQHPREVLKKSAELGVFSNDRIEELTRRDSR